MYNVLIFLIPAMSHRLNYATHTAICTLDFDTLHFAGGWYFSCGRCVVRCVVVRARLETLAGKIWEFARISLRHFSAGFAPSVSLQEISFAPFYLCFIFWRSHFLYSPSLHTRRISRHVHTFTLLCFVLSLRYVAHDTPPCKLSRFYYNLAPLRENICSILPELSQNFSLLLLAGIFTGLFSLCNGAVKACAIFGTSRHLCYTQSAGLFRAFTLNHGGRSWLFAGHGLYVQCKELWFAFQYKKVVRCSLSILQSIQRKHTLYNMAGLVTARDKAIFPSFAHSRPEFHVMPLHHCNNAHFLYCEALCSCPNNQFFLWYGDCVRFQGHSAMYLSRGFFRPCWTITASAGLFGGISQTP